MASNGYAIQEHSPKRAINYSIDNFMDLHRAFDGLNTSITNVYEMDASGLSSSKLPNEFWSYHSFPLYKGGTANRFNHNEFNNQNSWSRRYNSFLKNPVEKFLVNGNADELSPLEKYELVIGSESFSLTLKEWEKGKDYIDRTGTIPSWIGACHGTAPSSISHARPKNAVSVLSSDGKTSVLFYPSDIKALLAFAWTTNGGPSAVMGSRCNTFRNSTVNSCLDTNPGSFHLALTNLIGIHQKPFIVDVDSGPQVWNRPVVSYDISYFNPQFRNYTRTVSNAVVDIEKYHNDPYKNFRARGTKKIVGVRTEIELINDTNPNSALTDLNRNDRSFKLVYTYDLELDRSGEILGGMWHQPHFPDFVWAVSHENLPLSSSERWFTRTPVLSNGLDRLPLSLREIARNSRETDQVSYWAIDYLLRLSNEK